VQNYILLRKDFQTAGKRTEQEVNGLPDYLRDLTLSLEVFRRYLKSYLFARQ